MILSKFRTAQAEKERGARRSLNFNPDNGLAERGAPCRLQQKTIEKKQGSVQCDRDQQGRSRELQFRTFHRAPAHKCPSIHNSKQAEQEGGVENKRDKAVTQSGEAVSALDPGRTFASTSERRRRGRLDDPRLLE